MKVRMINGCFGFEKGFTYPAEKCNDGRWLVTNGSFKGYVFDEDVEVVE